MPDRTPQPLRKLLIVASSEAALLFSTAVVSAVLAAEYSFGGFIFFVSVRSDSPPAINVWPRLFSVLFGLFYGAILITRLVHSLRGRNLYARLSARDKAPRRWWYPPDPPDSSVPEDRAVVLHDAISATVRRTLWLLLSFNLFCLLTLAGQSDAALLQSQPTIRIPFVDVLISFKAFVIVSPLIAMALTYYLHTFVTELNKLTQLVGPHRHPDLFNLATKHARAITWILFYLLTPVTLVLIARRAAPFPDLGNLLILSSLLFSSLLLFSAIRRFRVEARQTRRYRLLWLLWILLPALFWELSLFGSRPFNLAGAKLDKENLSQRNLSGATLEGASLVNADLRRANLDSAYLRKAVLRDADLRGATLRNARLYQADLSNTRLIGADLEGAELSGVQLEGTDLRGAVLKGATLHSLDLSNAKVEDANFVGACVSDVVWPDGMKVKVRSCPEALPAVFWRDIALVPFVGLWLLFQSVKGFALFWDAATAT